MAFEIVLRLMKHGRYRKKLVDKKYLLFKGVGVLQVHQNSIIFRPEYKLLFDKNVSVVNMAFWGLGCRGQTRIP